jgi:hypothetical protein
MTTRRDRRQLGRPVRKAPRRTGLFGSSSVRSLGHSRWMRTRFSFPRAMRGWRRWGQDARAATDAGQGRRSRAAGLTPGAAAGAVVAAFMAEAIAPALGIGTIEAPPWGSRHRQSASRRQSSPAGTFAWLRTYRSAVDAALRSVLIATMAGAADRLAVPVQPQSAITIDSKGSTGRTGAS